MQDTFGSQVDISVSFFFLTNSNASSILVSPLKLAHGLATVATATPAEAGPVRLHYQIPPRGSGTWALGWLLLVYRDCRVAHRISLGLHWWRSVPIPSGRHDCGHHAPLLVHGIFPVCLDRIRRAGEARRGTAKFAKDRTL